MAEEDIAVKHLPRLSPEILQRRPVCNMPKNVRMAVAKGRYSYCFTLLCYLLLYYSEGGMVLFKSTIPHIGQIRSPLHDLLL